MSFHNNRDLRRPGLLDFLLLESVVLDWFMVSFCLFFWWSFTCQNAAFSTRNFAETTNPEDAFRTNQGNSRFPPLVSEDFRSN